MKQPVHRLNLIKGPAKGLGKHGKHDAFNTAEIQEDRDGSCRRLNIGIRKSILRNPF